MMRSTKRSEGEGRRGIWVQDPEGRRVIAAATGMGIAGVRKVVARWWQIGDVACWLRQRSQNQMSYSRPICHQRATTFRTPAMPIPVAAAMTRLLNYCAAFPNKAHIASQHHRTPVARNPQNAGEIDLQAIGKGRELSS